MPMGRHPMVERSIDPGTTHRIGFRTRLDRSPNEILKGPIETGLDDSLIITPVRVVDRGALVGGE